MRAVESDPGGVGRGGEGRGGSSPLTSPPRIRWPDGPPPEGRTSLEHQSPYLKKGKGHLLKKGEGRGDGGHLLKVGVVVL